MGNDPNICEVHSFSVYILWYILILDIYTGIYLALDIFALDTTDVEDLRPYLDFSLLR